MVELESGSWHLLPGWMKNADCRDATGHSCLCTYAHGPKLQETCASQLQWDQVRLDSWDWTSSSSPKQLHAVATGTEAPIDGFQRHRDLEATVPYSRGTTYQAKQNKTVSVGRFVLGDMDTGGTVWVSGCDKKLRKTMCGVWRGFLGFLMPWDIIFSLHLLRAPVRVGWVSWVSWWLWLYG